MLVSKRFRNAVMLYHLPWRIAIVTLHAAQAAGGDPSSHSPLGLPPLRFPEHIHLIALHSGSQCARAHVHVPAVVPEVCLGLAR